MLELHNVSIKAHLDNNIPYFTENVADSFVSVSGGEIFCPTFEDTNKMFTNYLSKTKFDEYKDLQDPIIGISADGSMGWTAVQV